MKSWTRPVVPSLPGRAPVPRLFDSSTRTVRAASPAESASLYVCGITPYDATHLGHANTYLAFDTLVRLWTDGGFTVRYAQNVTDIDDPLLERAAATDVDWRALAAEQIDLFRGDMESLRVLPPTDFVAVTDVIAEVAEGVRQLLDAGIAYRLDDDVYFDNSAAASAVWTLGDESGFDRATMLALSAQRGGDPERAGKRDALDPLLWRGERDGEPSWPSPVGAGRPGWHIECSVIAQRYLDTPMTVQGGGSDLVFPHHEFSAGHAAALTGRPLADLYAHAGMVAYDGEKMSKSLGNLVLVSRLTDDGVDPRAIRLALLDRHYRADWEWTRVQLTEAQCRLGEWETWAAEAVEGADATLVDTLRSALVNDLDTPAALAAVDARVASGERATATDVDAIDALLGVRL
ncbi:cysteine--1-D-myo-inosityl 2-amino-2-deoxy-alpha-D-glucopyranoside ligase [Conyzicola nivalis]|uniref:L-cysteine:1D-myo-inositol 2-amino-2-deoxy-alpha-D-glucopyranoside ligase n=1 Tax=Conyzicola nivalis TaxID=1477021 RepID=A0A916WG73_9MICO|nr:cysteine--1-D-myo-inosityl 2-amino-2-deoxy-alpha-D-glucopyranoside ligase [Conyzicola nivalis]GGA94748.1 L-cysteine:1D-myo-inositol 2-amino-2-deoxy-alpha-D-glucopyranoside ligase [Conyzicola nivalis]